MMKMKNVEAKLYELYRKEAESFRMPDENEIAAIRSAKASGHAAGKIGRPARYWLPIVSAALIAVLLMAVPLLRPTEKELPVSGLTSVSIRENEGCPADELTGDIVLSDGKTENTETAAPSDDRLCQTETADTAYPDLTALSLSQWLASEKVVWRDGPETKGNIAYVKSVGPGQAVIDDELKNSFESVSGDTVYAVMVDFSSMPHDDYVFEGKKISEMIAEKDALIARGKMEDAKLLAREISQAKSAYYFSMLETFEEEFASMGLGVYHETVGCTIDNCVFYTFATRAQLEGFRCGPGQSFIFSKAVRFK